MPSPLPIRVPAAWKIEHHVLLDEDPEFSAGVCANLSEDLLQIRCRSYVIDAGFYHDRYRIMLIQNEDWEHPLRQHDCQHRREVISTVEKWLRDIALWE